MNTIARILAALRSAPWLRVAVAPLLGAVIGYITNDLALKMLFRPYEAKYIGRLRLPFTPGLIPAQKARIAKSLGGVIAGRLLDAETLGREALSDAAMEKLRAAVSGWLEAQSLDERPLRERLAERVPPERIAAAEESAADRGAEIVMDKLRGAGLGEIVAEQVVSTIRRKLAHLPGAFLLDGAMEPLRAGVASSVERRLEQDGPAVIREKLAEAERALLDKSAAELTQARRARIPELTEAILGLYRELMEKHMGSILTAAHLDEIIERRIESFDARTLETVVFGVMRRELRAIVYLGALLGCLMGFINLLF